MVSKNNIFVWLFLVILLIISSQIVAREMNSEAPAPVTQAMMNGNVEAKGLFHGHHLLKKLGRIFRLGKVIYCHHCNSCYGLCGYCCV
ncbi:hypothetical protein P3S67_002448 [Capsicum chacoense]